MTNTELRIPRLLPAAAESLPEHLARLGPLPELEPAHGDRPGTLVRMTAAAGLRGRGGSWSPTAAKLHGVHRRHVERLGRRRSPVVIANGMESEPTSAKDVTLLRMAPHLVLDGLALCADAIGAEETFLALRAGSGAESTVRAALADRSHARVPGAVHLKVGTQELLAGEEGALAAWISGKPAKPTSVPPHLRGVSGRPTLVLNTETLAHIALLARFGPQWFRDVGSATASGTTLVTVSGAVAAPAVVEVPLGTPVGEILAAAGGPVGEPTAVLTGGSSGAWLPWSETSSLPWEPEHVDAAGGVMGASVLRVLSADTCGLIETARMLRWMAGQGAGQCGPCRFGMPAVADDMGLLAQGLDGERRERDATALWLRLTRRIGLLPGRGACDLPDGAAGLASSAMTVFEGEVAAHLYFGGCKRSASWPDAAVAPWQGVAV